MLAKNFEQMNKLQIYFFSIFFLISLVSLIIIFRPFLTIITISGILSIAIYPWYKSILKIFRGNESLSSLIVIVLVLILIIAPLLVIGRQILNELLSIYRLLSVSSELNLPKLPPTVEEYIQIVVPNLNLSFEIDIYAKLVVGWMAKNFTRIFSGTIEIILGILLTLISFYFFLRDGEKFKDWLIRLSPLEKEHNKAIFSSLYQTVNAVVVGTLLIALIQGLLVSISFFIFGIPNFMLWGMLAALLSAAPGVGTWLITIPATLYLFFSGRILAAAGLAVLSILFVGLVNNILLPYFYSRGNHIHPLLILFAVFGGLVTFGAVGFLLGPMVLSIFLALIRIYEILIKKNQESQDFSNKNLKA